MALNCGIVGLPNVGKSTIFQALCGAPAEVANYPFCTINPNVGIVAVPDQRLLNLQQLFKPARTIPATVEFVDIAGLVKGASKGEGLGNQFLSHIREVGIIAHVVRCFENPDIIHVENRVDPDNDMDIIAFELALADIDTLLKRKERAERTLKVSIKAEQKAAEIVLVALDKIYPVLQDGGAARSAPLTDEERSAVYDCHFITMKPQLYVCNVDETGVQQGNGYVEQVKKRARSEGADTVCICGKFEAELADIAEPAERLAFLAELGLKESGLNTLIRAAYRLLGLRTFFTAGPDECRAWTVPEGSSAPEAAGVIHSDFEKGFIKAEVYSFDDIMQYRTEAKIKEAGKYRIEGKDYTIQDGDVVFFRFNV